MTLREVLVVDDSDADLLYAQVVLEAAAVATRVRTFETGQDALAYLQRPEGHSVDVVLLDINMPEINGFEFLDAYEKLHREHRARAGVVMLTSSPDPRDRERAFSFSCVKDYVLKPIDVASAAALVKVAASADV